MSGQQDDMPFMDSPLSRVGRRASISMPGLDLLTKIAEHTWQTKPQINSSFDDLAEVGVADATPRFSPRPNQRRVGQVAGPSHGTFVPHRHYQPVRDSESDIDDMSDFSEIESPVEVTFTSPKKAGGVKTVKRVSMNPQGRRKKKDDHDDTIPKLKPLATRRNSGVIPLKIADSNFLKSDPSSEDEEDSNKVASPTPSARSLTSLLREKLHSMPVPALFRKRKPKEYKLQIFVAILFLTIILLVGSIYVIHHEKELQKLYYDRIRFSHRDRRILVKNLRGRDVLRGILGVNLTKKDKAWPCLDSDLKKDYTCLEWMNIARLYFKKKQTFTPQLEVDLSFSSYGTNSSSYSQPQPSVQCYEIYWESLNPETELKDCFDLGEKWGGHFYGGGELPGSNNWPLNKTRVTYSPFLTGNKIPTEDGFQWGRTLKRFFVNSEGAAIQITEDTPLHVSINDKDQPRKLCIGSKVGSFGFGDELISFLNYSICTGDNVRETNSHLAEKDLWDGLKRDDHEVTRSLANSTIWRILPEIMESDNAETALLNHTNQIADLHLSEGFILIDESWQKHIGDLEMDPLRFPTMGETFNITRRRGFKVALTIQPFFSTQSSNYEEGLYIPQSSSSSDLDDDGIWLSETSNNVPALTKYKKWNSVAVLDVTNKKASAWLEKKVSTLVGKYGIDALYIDLGTAYDLPQFYSFSNSLSSSDHYKDLFLQALRPIPHVKTIGVSSAVKLPKLPTFVSLSPTESSWGGLQTVIPNILSMGVAGYPFIIPGSIGGDYFPSNQLNSVNSSSKRLLPDRDLYIRWLELVHFLPVVQYSFLPNDYDQAVVDIATKMHKMRKEKLSNYIKKAIDESLTTGLPIIRPLWMIDPTDPNCLKVSDEFSIGGDIVVAPVINPNEQYRDIYLPKGIWRNEIDKSPTKGEKWLHNYPVKKDQIPFFTKISDVSVFTA